MKNKKGFTLIELLAVIVILAIIVLIAIPIILNMINNARKQAAIDTAYGYVESVEYAMGLSDIGATGYQDINIKNQEYEIEDPDLANIKIKGKKPDSGTINIEKRKITTGSFCIDGYKVDYDGKEARASKSNSCKTGGSSEDEEEVVEDKVPCQLETEKIDNKDVYYIDSVEDMYALSASVNGGNNYEGKTIVLRNNLDFSNYTKEAKTTVCENNDNSDGFTPIGTSSNNFKGTFDGGTKTIKNLTINRPSANNVGIFGYTNNAIINGLILDNINVTGASYVGALVGRQQYGKSRYIVVNNATVKGNERVAGIAGEGGYTQFSQIIIKNITLESSGWAASMAVSAGNQTNTIVEHATIKAANVDDYGVNRSNAVVVNNNQITNGFDESSIGDLNYYDSLSIDTWINGDNDPNRNNNQEPEEDGYYFDYDNASSKNVVLKTVESSPIPTDANQTFDKEGDFYLIKNVTDWKNATAFANKELKFKLVNDLDFNGKKFYMMGSTQKPFKGTFDGNAKTIKNITINNPQQTHLGIFGKIVEGSSRSFVYGLNLENINMKGYQYVGSLAGYTDYSSVKTIAAYNITVEATNGRGSAIVGESNYSGLSYHLMDNITVKGPNNNYIGYGTINNGDHGVVEHADMTAGNIYIGGTYAISNHVKINGTEITNGFNKDLVGDLSYYSSYLDTPLTGDIKSDNIADGYYFGYDNDKNRICVVKIENNQGWKRLTNKEPKENQKWVYYKADGTKYNNELVSGITDLSGTLQDYYFDEKGMPIKGWKQIGGYWYYFSEQDSDNNGWIDFNKVRGGNVTIGNKTCTFDSDGKCTSDNCGP